MDSYLEKKLGEFKILRQLGRGGMGVVYEAFQPSLSRKVALKILPPAISLDEKAVERFHREAASAARLHHPNIVPIYSVGSELGNHFYAMEYIAGRTLGDILVDLRRVESSGSRSTSHWNREWESRFLRVLTSPSPETPADERSPTLGLEPPAGDSAEPENGGTAAVEALTIDGLLHEISAKRDSRTARDSRTSSTESTFAGGLSGWWQAVSEIVAQVAEALHYAHGESVVHRDIKPSNVILTPGGRPLVLDFGLALDLSSAQLTQTGAFLGTPMYMSPEQASGHVKVDHRTDIYSLGISLYELATLSLPFDGNRDQLLKQIMFKEPPAPRRVNPRIPVDVNTIILKAIEKDPDRRYQSAAELADDLRRFRQGRPISARPAGLLSMVWKQARWHRARIAVAAVVLACLGVGLVSLLSSISTKEELARLQEQEAVDKLLADLDAEEADTRAKAARALADLEDPRATSSLIAAAADPSAQVRARIVAALGRIEDRAALPALMRALEDSDSGTRAEAATALASFAEPKALSALETALKRAGPTGSDRPQILAALRASAGRADSARFVELWKERLIDSPTLLEVVDASVVPAVAAELSSGGDHAVEAASILEEIGDRRAAATLLDVLQSSRSEQLRVACVKALATMVAAADAPVLVRGVRKEGWGDFYDAAREALRAIPQAALDAVEGELENADERTAEVLTSTVAALAYHGAAGHLGGLLRDGADRPVTSYMKMVAIDGLDDLDDAAALDLVLDSCGDPAVAVRQNAVEYLDSVDGARSIEALVGFLDDGEDRVLRAAVFALDDAGVTGSPAAVERIIGFAGHGSPDVRRAVAHTLGEIGRAEPLVGLLGDREVHVRAHAADHLGLARYEPAVTALVSALEDPSPVVRSQAATALGRIGHRLAVQPVIAVLGDSDPSVAQEAAGALERIGDAQAVRPLIEAAYRLAGEKDAREALVFAIARFRDASVAAIVEDLDSDDASTRRRAVELLGELGSRRAAQELALRVDDGDAGVRAAAARALGALGDVAATPAMARLLTDSQKSVRAVALEAIGTLPLTSAPDEVVAIAADDADPLQHVATRVLGQIQDPATEPALRELGGRDDPRVRRQAAIALAYLGAADAAGLLDRELDHAGRSARETLVGALHALGTPQALEVLRRVAASDQPPVAKAAIAALGSFADPGAHETLRSLAAHSRIEVRMAAVQALGRLPAGAGVQDLLGAIADAHPPVIVAGRDALDLAWHPSIAAPASELLELLRRDGHPWTRAICARHLRACPGEETVRALIGVLGDRVHLVRSEAAASLGHVGDASAAAALAPLATSAGEPIAGVRVEAVLALGRLGAEDAVDVVATALEDAHGNVRQSAAWALGLLAPREREDVVARLIGTLADQHVHVGSAAAFALGEIGGPTATGALGKLVRDPSTTLAQAAVSALAAALGRDAVPELAAAVARGRPAVAQTAAAELGTVGDERAIEPLLALLGETQSLRSVAAESLARIHRRLGRELPAIAEAALDEEVRRLRKRLRTTPDDAVTRNSLAWSLAVLGRDLDEALAHAARATYLSPGSAGFLDTLAYVHRVRGELAEAIAVRKSPVLRASVSFSPAMNRKLIRELEREGESGR